VFCGRGRGAEGAAGIEKLTKVAESCKNAGVGTASARPGREIPQLGSARNPLDAR